MSKIKCAMCGKQKDDVIERERNDREIISMCEHCFDEVIFLQCPICDFVTFNLIVGGYVQSDVWRCSGCLTLLLKHHWLPATRKMFDQR